MSYYYDWVALWGTRWKPLTTKFQKYTIPLSTSHTLFSRSVSGHYILWEFQLQLLLHKWNSWRNDPGGWIILVNYAWISHKKPDWLLSLPQRADKFIFQQCLLSSTPVLTNWSEVAGTVVLSLNTITARDCSEPNVFSSDIVVCISCIGLAYQFIFINHFGQKLTCRTREAKDQLRVANTRGNTGDFSGNC